MKIYTITFGFSYNYGAILQMYALIKHLKNNNHLVKGVNYVPDYYVKKNSNLNLQTAIIKILSIGKKRKFNKFKKKHIPLTEKCKDKMDIVNMEQPDIYIAGSDQIWNEILLGKMDDVFFLNFKTTAKKIFYAASVGRTNISEEEIERIKDKIQDVKCISTREEELRKELEKVGVKDVVSVLDPVFLLKKEEYISIASKTFRKKYILLYQMQSNELNYAVVKRLKEKFGLQVWEIGKIKRREEIDKTIYNAGPSEFLGLIRDAEYVVTNSFHGIAFSIIMEKEFWAPGIAENTGIRIYNLLECLELTHRIIGQNYTQGIDSVEGKIDYAIVQSHIKEYLKKSESFLRESIRCSESKTTIEK